ncbi:exocyst complex component EXO70C1-like [Miscanthus floridulus]|uniref:exocyst complex component EXO70C1-like n=1 Tax=Miscanthus floridulus TaxID=154761 RepID=UPI00345AA8A5
MADALVAAGYMTECSQMFLVARRNAFDSTLQGLGYEKSNIDDVVKMTWEALEAVIVTWTKAFRHAINVGLSTEHELCTRVFAGRHAAVGHDIFVDLSRCVMLHMLSFTEAVAMIKRTTKKLFKVLDMYEAVRDTSQVIEAFMSADEPAAAEHHSHHSGLAELKSEIAAVRSQLGESAVAIFRELESSIRADAGKQPVPSGVVHPLTPYVMNYLKYACEYNSTLEQVFRELHHGNRDDSNPFAADSATSSERVELCGKERNFPNPKKIRSKY